MNKISRITACFEFNEKAKKLADPRKLDQLLRISSSLFQEVYKPNCKRIGLKFLENRPPGSCHLAFWPSTFREVIQLKDTDFPIKLDEEGSMKQGKLNLSTYEHLPMQSRFVYQSFMRMNDVRRKKKLRSITAMKAKKAK